MVRQGRMNWWLAYRQGRGVASTYAPPEKLAPLRCLNGANLLDLAILATRGADATMPVACGQRGRQRGRSRTRTDPATYNLNGINSRLANLLD